MLTPYNFMANQGLSPIASREFIMLKNEFVQKLMAKNNLSRNEAEKILNAFMDSVEDGLFKDKRLDLRGFGVFNVRRRKQRNAINPATGESVVVPETNVIHFKGAPTLTDLIN